MSGLRGQAHAEHGAEGQSGYVCRGRGVAGVAGGQGERLVGVGAHLLFVVPDLLDERAWLEECAAEGVGVAERGVGADARHGGHVVDRVAEQGDR